MSRYLSSAPPTITFSTEEAATVTIHVKSHTGKYDSDIYKETLSPIDETITLTGLSNLLTPYCRKYFHITVTVTCSAAGQADNTFDLYHCEAIHRLGEKTNNGDLVLNNITLTTFHGTKRLTEQSVEYYRIQCLSTGSSLNLSVTVTDTGGTRMQANIVASRNADYGYHEADVSPKTIATALSTTPAALASYTVKYKGSQARSFIIDHGAPTPTLILRFLNPFGLAEYAYFHGAVEASSAFTRSNTRIDGNLSTYAIEETRTFKANTGPLTIEEAAWFEDLLRSTEVYICNYDARYTTPLSTNLRIVITDAEAKLSTDPAATHAFTVEYQYAQPTADIFLFPADTPRIFSDIPESLY